MQGALCAGLSVRIAGAYPDFRNIKSIAWLPSPSNSLVSIYIVGEERHCESKVS